MKKLQHLVESRPRLTVAVVSAAVAFTLCRPAFSWVTSLLIAWNTLAWVYLGGLWWLMGTATPQYLRNVVRVQDQSAARVLTLICGAAVMSLVAIFFEFAGLKALDGLPRATHVALTGATVLGAWLLVPTVFAVHYAHLFHKAPTGAKPLRFPDNPAEPACADFMYFAFTVAVASQTADVSVGTSACRRVVLVQSVISYWFNAAVLGLVINVAAGMLG